jgi:site-specific recombinase XerD
VPATINRALSTLRGYCAWAAATGVMSESAAREIEDVPTPELAPRSLPAVKALLRSARAEQDAVIRLRDEAALLIYGGMRVQEACDLQLRDVDLAGLSITVRYGKAHRASFHADAQRLLQRYLMYLTTVRGLPVRLHYTWLLVLLLGLPILSRVTLPGYLPELGSLATIALALLILSLFFGVVVVHELAHLLIEIDTFMDTSNTL